MSLEQAPSPSSNLDLLADTTIGIEERNRLLEGILNPDALLPLVQLERIPMASNELRLGYTIYEEQGEGIGTITIRLPGDGDIYASVRGVGIHPDYAGKNYGKSAYLAALKSLPANVGLKNSEVSLTPGSYKIWSWLEEKGVVVANHTREQAQLDDTGHYLGLEFKTIFGQGSKPEELSLFARAVRIIRRNR